MKTRGAAIQGGLAAAALLLAYATWQREPEKAPGEATVLDVGKSDITKVRFEEGQKFVELEPKQTEEGLAVWLKVSAKPSPAPAPERHVRGNAGSEKLLDKLAPLRATRALGVLEPAKLKELTLDAPKKKLTIVARGVTHVFDVGAPTGVSDPYVKDQKDGRVYVLGGGIVSDLDSAAVRLIDRRLHSFEPIDWDGLSVSVGAKKRELMQTGAKPVELKLLSKKTQKPDAEAKNWHDKVFRLVVTEVLGEGEKPADGEPQPLLKLEYTQKGKTKGFLEIGRAPAPAAPSNTSMPAAPAANGALYARSERSAGWMKLAGTAEDVIKEADKVVAGE